MACMNSSIRLAVSLLVLIAPSAGGEQGAPSEWEKAIVKAESPLRKLRENFIESLRRKKREFDESGRMEMASLMEKKIKGISDGAWPSGGDSFSSLDAKFLIHYWRRAPRVTKALRAIAGKSEDPKVDSAVQERIDYWFKEPPGSSYNPGKNLLSYNWEVRRNPLQSGALGSHFETLEKAFKGYGVSLPKGAGVAYVASSNLLVVKSIALDLVLVDSILDKKNLR